MNIFEPFTTQPPSVRIEAFHVADFVQPDGSAIAGRPGIVMAYAVVHPEGVLVFDTGIGFGEAEIELAYRPVVRVLPDLLRARGIEPDLVTLAKSMAGGLPLSAVVGKAA